MKKLLYFFTLCLFISCSDSESIVEVNESDLLGTWDLTALTSSVEAKTTFQGISSTSKTKLTGKDISSQFTFTQNPNEYQAYGKMTIVSETTSLLGNQTDEYETESVNGLENGTWEIDGDNLTLIGQDSQEIILKVDSYTDNKLVLKQKVNESQSINGATINITGSATLKFER